MTERPRIGITTSYEDGRQTLDEHYVRAVEDAAGIPVIVPMLRQDSSAREFAALLDALIITGGPGITLGLIGDLPDDLPPVSPARNRSDKLIYQAMADRPLLGICYGMQFANAMAGGTIYADVQAQRSAAVHSAERGAEQHEIAVMPGTVLYAILGVDRLQTNTHHIQAIAELGTGLQVSARAGDDVIEAIESADGRVIGVQFHPERMDGGVNALFADLVRRAERLPSS